MDKSAIVLGAVDDSGNIGDCVANRLVDLQWDVLTHDCSVNRGGTRPPGGNIPSPEVGAPYGYEQGPEGHYLRYEAPSYDFFKRLDADALVITLGKTYKGHFAEIEDHEVNQIIRANLTLPLECARRYVSASEKVAWESPEPGACDRIRHIVFVGSYAHDHPFTNGTLYCAAKAGLDMAARTLGWELTDRGYRVHIVHPYHVNGTPMWAQVEKDVMRSKDMTWEEADAYNRKDLKMPDLLTAPEVAGAIASLLSTPELGWLSGQSLSLYGGSR